MTQELLHGKIYVVTGGTQGFGKEIALYLAQQGAEGIVICGRNAENGAASAEE